MRLVTLLTLVCPLTVIATAPPSTPPPAAALVEVQVKDVVQSGDANVVLLMPKGETVAVPVFIGDAEAVAIRLKLARQTPPRPLTHDLLETMIRSLGGRVVQVQIDDLRDGVFLGQIQLAQGDRKLQVDARPSDAIALALRTGSPIFVARKVIDAAGVTKGDLERGRGREPPRPDPSL